MALADAVLSSRGLSAQPPQRDGLALVPLHLIHPCPLQPRVNVSLDLVHKLAMSMRAGRHKPLLEVEPSTVRPGHYQIVCGEQRWRAAREAGLEQVLVRILPKLGYLERLRKQYEENRLRGDLTVREEAELILLSKALNDISAAEQMLSEASVLFEPLDSKPIAAREQIFEHLELLKTLLVKRRIGVIKTGHGAEVGPLSLWHKTEESLGISEATRKERLAVLRLEPDLLAEIEQLPAQHATLIARVADRAVRARLIEHAPQLTNRQLHGVVDRLRRDPGLSVEDAIAAPSKVAASEPLAFEIQIDCLADLCRQLRRMLANLRISIDDDESRQVGALLADLRLEIDAFQNTRSPKS